MLTSTLHTKSIKTEEDLIQDTHIPIGLTMTNHVLGIMDIVDLVKTQAVIGEINNQTVGVIKMDLGNFVRMINKIFINLLKE